MKQSRKAKSLLEALLVIGLILIIPLFFAVKSRANSQVVPNTAVLTEPTIQNTTSVSSTAAKRPAQCSFPLAQSTTTESSSEAYSFAEPKVVLTAPKGNSYTIVEWLPDSQQVLMTEALRGNSKPDEVNPEEIRLFNPETGESKVYAIRPETHEPPSWQSASNAVIYPVKNFYLIDTKNHIAKFTYQIWVSYGTPDTAQLLNDNLSQLPVAIKTSGGETIYFADKKISKLDKSLKKLSSASFDSDQWDYAKTRRNDIPVSYKMAWQPGTSLIFMYSEGATQGGGYTFILNADTGQVCELDLQGWAKVARWSSDGRYLAIIKSTQYTFPTYSSDLIVLDTVTGKLITLDVIPQEIEGLHFVDDFVWAPDNRHLLAMGDVYTPTDNQTETRLYLVDFVTGERININFSYEFVTNSPQSMAWSPDGSKLLMRCPTREIDQICLISVTRTEQ